MAALVDIINRLAAQDKRAIQGRTGMPVWEQHMDNRLRPFAEMLNQFLAPVDERGLPNADKGITGLADVLANITKRNSVFHSTQFSSLFDILRDRAIKTEKGVSVSRTPVPASMESRNVHLMLDPQRMPTTQPIAEPAWAKTVLGKPNPTFEAELRTKPNQNIPLEAVKEAWMEKEPPLLRFSKTPEERQRIQDLVTYVLRVLQDSGIPVRTFDSLQEMRSGRARLPHLKEGTSGR